MSSSLTKRFRILTVSAAAALLAGCASLHQIDFPESSSNKGKKVTASINHLNIFFLVPPSAVDKVVDDLSEQCGNGKVEGITMTYTRRFVYIGEMVNIFAAGRCSE